MWVLPTGGYVMPKWAGRWKGGRYYLDAKGKRTFFIEGNDRVVKLQTHDEDLAVGELARFRQDPVAYCRQPEPEPDRSPVYINTERLALYIESIRKTCIDHQKARRAYLADWSALGLDLRTADKKVLRLALAKFDGGHRGRVEALNAFCNWLVREEDLPSWNPLVNTYEALGRVTRKGERATRGERQAYSLAELRETYERLPSQWVKDAFYLRIATGMHHTEIEQLEGARVQKGPLPDRGAAIRTLDGDQEIRGVLQVRQKTKPRHRISVDAATLAAATRLIEGVPHRMSMWKALDPLIPSNLRHTFITLAGEVGQLVSYKTAGVTLDAIQNTVGHRVGSKVTLSNYDKLQVPPMVRLPIVW